MYSWLGDLVIMRMLKSILIVYLMLWSLSDNIKYIFNMNEFKYFFLTANIEESNEVC